MKMHRKLKRNLFFYQKQTFNHLYQIQTEKLSNLLILFCADQVKYSETLIKIVKVKVKLNVNDIEREIYKKSICKCKLDFFET